MTLKIHLCIIQPAGYIHSQGFLDQARYARYQFRRLGAEVSLGKNRLREDSINIVFGAHLGFDPNLKRRYDCVFFNLEQLGSGGAGVTQNYITLLNTSLVIDYDCRNLEAYHCKPGAIPVVSFSFAPYLSPKHPIPIQERPIDLLFYGSLNARRASIIELIERSGWSVAQFDHPLYGAERDEYILQSKAVLNCHFYETSRFEQARAFHTLSLGTPLISERANTTHPPAGFEESVTWLPLEELGEFFGGEFMSPEWIEKANTQIESFKNSDAITEWKVVYDYCAAAREINSSRIPTPWRPHLMQLGTGSGEHYQIGWLNIDREGDESGDLALNLERAISLPCRLPGTNGGYIGLTKGQFEKIRLRESVPNPLQNQSLLRNLLSLLKTEGRLEVVVCLAPPNGKMEQNEEVAKAILPWSRIADHFWLLGDIDHRLELAGVELIDEYHGPKPTDQPTAILVTLQKTTTTPRERTLARMHLPDFGILHDEEIAIY